MLAKSRLRLAHLNSSSTTSTRSTAGVALQARAVPQQCEIAAGTASIALIALEPGFGGALGVRIALGPRHRRRGRRIGRETLLEGRHRAIHRIAGGLLDQRRNFRKIGPDVDMRFLNQSVLVVMSLGMFGMSVHLMRRAAAHDDELIELAAHEAARSHFGDL